MTPTEAKLKAVQDRATLKDVKDVRSFLGFANNYKIVRPKLCSNCKPPDLIDTKRRGSGVPINDAPFSS